MLVMRVKYYSYAGEILVNKIENSSNTEYIQGIQLILEILRLLYLWQYLEFFKSGKGNR